MAYNDNNGYNNGSPLNRDASNNTNAPRNPYDNYQAFAIREKKSQKLRIVNAREYSAEVRRLLDGDAKYQKLLDDERHASIEMMLKHNAEYKALLTKRANAKDKSEQLKIQAAIEAKEAQIRRKSAQEIKRINKLKRNVEGEKQELALQAMQSDFQRRFSKMRRYEQQLYFENERRDLGYTISALHDQITALQEKSRLSKADREQLAQFEAELDNQLEARTELIQRQLRLQTTVTAERLQEEEDAYNAALLYENEFYRIDQHNTDDRRKNREVLAEQEHHANMQRLRQEHHDAIKYIKNEHELKMEELEYEARLASMPNRVQHDLNQSREADTAEIIKNGQQMRLNNAKLNDNTRFHSAEERMAMHNQNFETLTHNNAAMAVAQKAEKRALKELAKNKGVTVADIKKMLADGVEFEDKDKDLINVIKDAQQQQGILGGLTRGFGGTFLEGLLGGNGIMGSLKGVLTGALGKVISGPIGTVVSSLSKVAGKLNAKLGEHMDAYYQYQSALETRLNGSDHEYDAIQKLVRSQIGNSPYVTQTKVMERIADLVEKGIAQNVEERALLMALGDKLVTTFEADNASLLRLIRLQQRDTTSLYMGMEGFLNKLLNQWFEDTSYLTDEFDTIESLLLDLDSTMSDSVGVNFAIQKWMAALSTMGMSGGTLEKLTEGLVALGTGDINMLSSNESLQSLFAIVANNKNLHYGEMLTNGITESNINTIMRGVVEYLNDINMQNNNVVLAQYQQLFNMSRADFEAISNLAQSSKFGAVYNAYSTSAQSKMWLDDYVDTIGDRMHLSEKMDNLVENALTTLGTSISDNAVTYGLWRVNEFLGGLDLPLISDVATLANSVVAIGAGIKNIGQITSALTKTFKITLDDWEVSDFETRSRGKSLPTPSIAASAPAASSAGGATSGVSSSYSMSSRSAMSEMSNNNPSYVQSMTSSQVSYSDQISDIASYVDDEGNTLADYQKQLNAITNSVSKSSLTEASSVAATSITSAEVAKTEDTLDKLYNDLFDRAIMVKPDTGWSEVFAPATAVASIENVSKTITEVNKLINNSNNTMNVTITNSTLKTESAITNVNDVVKTVLTSVILTALRKQAEQQESARAEQKANSQYTIDDLIFKIINGEVAVNVANNNFDTAVSKYLMEN